MIINRRIKMISKTMSKIRFGYIKQNDIDQAKIQYGVDTQINRFRGTMAFVKLLCIQSFRDAKSDYYKYKEIGQIKVEERQDNEQREYLRIKSDIFKAIPAFTILNIPGGAPFFFTYILLFPNLAPTWVLTQSSYKSLEAIKQDNMVASLNHFKKQYNTEDFKTISQKIAENYAKMKEGAYIIENKNQFLRQICILLAGQYRDGTYYICKYSPLKHLGIHLSYLFHPELSCFLLQNQIESTINKNTLYYKQYYQIKTPTQRLSFLLHKQLRHLQQK